MKNRFPFTCGICIRPALPCQNSARELMEHLHKRLFQEGFLFFWNLPQSIHIPGLEVRNRLSQGKCALPHALLRTDEVEDELLLATGTNLIEHIFPPGPAPYRKALRKIYRERGRLFLEGREKLFYLDSRKILGFPLIRLNGTQHYPALKKRMRQLRHSGQTENIPLIIIIDAETAEAAEETVLMLIKLRRKFRFEALELDDLLKAAARILESATFGEDSLPVQAAEQSLPASPESRYQREIAWDTPTETRKLLLARALESEKTSDHREPGPLPVPERGIIAHMPGEVEMEEGDITAFFCHGELAGLSKSGTTEFIHNPSSAWLETEKSCVRARSIGSFSFQNDSIRGLRDISLFESEDFLQAGRLVRDYFFAAGDSRLCISFYFFFSQCRPGIAIKSYGLCEIPLQLAEGLPLMNVHYPEEEASSVPLDAVSGGLLHGTAFSFAGKSSALNLEFADHQTKVRELPFSVSGGILRINPGGSYCGFSGDMANGIAERFSIVVSLDTRTPGSRAVESLASLLPHLENHQICFLPDVGEKS